MIRHKVRLRILALAVAAAAFACGDTPELDVQAERDEAASAAQPAPGDTPQPMAAHPPVEGAAAPQMPPDHPPIDGATAPGMGGMGTMAGGVELAPVPEGSGQGAAAIAWNPPAAWKAETPSSSMRRAQYRVPGPGGDGECVVFYFGPGQGGDPASNAERWASQFLDDAGAPAAAKTRRITVDGIEVLFVEAAGTYQAGSMMGMGQGTPMPGWALLGAIAQGPDANWFFKLTGPAATVEANRAAFESMLGSLRRGG